ncbi:MAG: DUF4147 domain-containing protein [Deltaproteobacteria bacterium]|nr:DUF4147 domain-containing protein [Deltaproteobacteria bacterium]
MAAGPVLAQFKQLASRGDHSARKPVVEALELALKKLNSYHIIKKHLKRKGDRLTFGQNSWDLAAKKNIYVIGGGKAANAMARAIEEILGDRITAGIVAVKELEPGDRLERIELVAAGHPLPDENSLVVSKRIFEIVQQATPDDLFIGIISGGSSALLSCPLPGITLEDEIACTQKLLTSGARILEINAVRRHVSAINGGRLAQAIDQKGAEMINFIISDGVGNAPATDLLEPARFFGTPVAPDMTTFSDACNVLEKYNLIGKVPASIVAFIRRANPRLETPKALSDRICHFVVQKVADAGTAAMEAATSIGIRASVLTTCLQGESREAGTFLACIAREIATYHRPVAPPCVVIAVGETTTTIGDQSGLGGPSQELALGFALEISGQKGVCMAAIDTDGTDGSTRSAGGIVDGLTVERAENMGIDVYHRLQMHDSLAVFQALGDEIVTGNTGTNVCDLNLVSIL